MYLDDGFFTFSHRLIALIFFNGINTYKKKWIYSAEVVISKHEERENIDLNTL
jgi:hypothetical protein